MQFSNFLFNGISTLGLGGGGDSIPVWYSILWPSFIYLLEHRLWIFSSSKWYLDEIWLNSNNEIYSHHISKNTKQTKSTTTNNHNKKKKKKTIFPHSGLNIYWICLKQIILPWSDEAFVLVVVILVVNWGWWNMGVIFLKYYVSTWDSLKILKSHRFLQISIKFHGIPM